jgi:hypothetical protein
MPPINTLHPASLRDRTLSDFDRYEIARIRKEAPALSFEQAKLLHNYRGWSSHYFKSDTCVAICRHHGARF